MESRTLPDGKLFLLDSDYRGGAILYTLLSTLLFSYSVYGAILFEKIRRKPSQSITYSEATAAFALSIILSIISGSAFIFSIYKLVTNAEQRSLIYKAAVEFANKPTGYPSDGKIDQDALRKETFVKTPEEVKERVPENVPKKRNIFIDEIFDEGKKFKSPLNLGAGYE